MSSELEVGSLTNTIHITDTPSLRARILQGVISRLTHVSEIGLENVRHHRYRLERMASFVPQLKHVSYEPATLDGFSAEWITPRYARQDRILYYLHGGGYAICSVNTHRKLIASIARKAGVKAFAINYRLAPEHPFPAAVHDAVKGYEAVLGKGFSPDKIFIAGDSAGGGLTIATLLRLREKGIPLPAAAVCIAPWIDLEGTGESHVINAKRERLLSLPSIRLWGKAYAGNEDIRHPLASPLYADLTGLPPLYIQVSTDEMLLDDSVRLHERALLHGVNSTLEKWKGLIHVWHVHTFLPEAKRAIGNIAEFANRHIS